MLPCHDRLSVFVINQASGMCASCKSQCTKIRVHSSYFEQLHVNILNNIAFQSLKMVLYEQILYTVQMGLLCKCIPLEFNYQESHVLIPFFQRCTLIFHHVLTNTAGVTV